VLKSKVFFQSAVSKSTGGAMWGILLRAAAIFFVDYFQEIV
jgi:hypothetical protein